jgi:predicted TIM-barrel fold metal-dependent hydrolase
MFRKMPDGEFVDRMRRLGISRACGSVIRRLHDCGDFAEIRRLNTECLSFRDKYPDFFIPGAQVHPSWPAESCAEIERLHKNEGLRWVGELVGYMTNFKTYVSEGAFEIYSALQEFGLPVNIHDFSVEEIGKIAEAFPRLNIIIAHPADGLDVMKNRISYIGKHPNVHLDISGHAPDRWGMLRYAVDTAGKEKILFGSDFPICNPASYISIVETELDSDEERKAVLSGNFKRLTGIK